MRDRQWQVELWQECGSKCAFCYLKEDNRFTPDELKLDSLRKTIAGLDELRKSREYNAVSYIGGEKSRSSQNFYGINEKDRRLGKRWCNSFCVACGYNDDRGPERLVGSTGVF